MSPNGRVNVALAGLTTSVLAAFFTLLDSAAAGKLTTKIAEPITVATRQAGRTTTASTATVSGPLPSAELETAPPRPTASTHTIVMTLAFIPFTFSESARLVEHILDCGASPHIPMI